EYSTDLFAEESIEALLGRFEKLLHAVCDEQPIPALIGAGEKRLLSAWNATGTSYSKLLHEMVAEQDPDAIAAEHGDRKWTYGELERRANQLAHRIVRLGARHVAIALPPGFDMLVAVLGVLKAGAACVPLDPSHPA